MADTSKVLLYQSGDRVYNTQFQKYGTVVGYVAYGGEKWNKWYYQVLLDGAEESHDVFEMWLQAA